MRFLRMVFLVAGLGMVTGVAGRADGPGDLKADAAKKAVAAQVSKLKAEDLKTLDDLKDFVDVDKIKKGEGLTYTYTPAKKEIKWEYTEKKETSPKQKKDLETVLQKLVGDTLAGQKDALKLTPAQVTELADLAKKTVVTAEPKTVTPVVVPNPLADLKTPAAQKAVADYVAKIKPDDWKSLDELKDVVDLDKIKKGEELTYTYTTAKKEIKWEYVAKKPLSDKQKKDLEAALQKLAGDSLATQKEPLKLNPAQATELADLAKKTVVAEKKTVGDGGIGVGVGTGVKGELTLDKLTSEGLKATVKKYLDTKPEGIKAVDKLAYTKPVLDGENLTVTVADGKPKFDWKYPAKSAEPKQADKDKVAAALKAALTASLTAETDPKTKLVEADLKTAVEAVKDATVSELAYSKVLDLSSDTLQDWVKKYVAKNPAEFEPIATYVAVNSVKEATYLEFDKNAATIQWSYIPAAGRKLTPGEREIIRTSMAEALSKAATAYGKGDGYTEADVEAIVRGARGAIYEPFEKTDLSYDSFDQAKVREILRAYFEYKPTAKTDLENLGVAATTADDRNVLVDGLKATKKGKALSFEWEYRLLNPSVADTINKDPIVAGLKDLLTNAIKAGGGKLSLKLSKNDYDSYVKPAINGLKTTVKKEFSLAELKTDRVRAMVEGYVFLNDQLLLPLEPLVKLESVRGFPANLTYDSDKVAFAWKLTAKKKLSDEEKKTVVTTIQGILEKSFRTPAKPADILAAKDLDRVAMAAAKADIVVLEGEDAKNAEAELARARAAEAEKREREARELEREERLKAIEDEVKELRRLIEQVSNSQNGGQAVAPAPAPAPAPQLYYVEQRVGLFGCKRVLVPCYK